MSATLNIGSCTMPPGEYWVGDPCYGVPDERWMEWLMDAGIEQEPIPRFMLAELDGHAVLGVGTYGGDGVYYDKQGREYPVDAGLIGLVPVEIVTGEPFGMKKINFPNGVTVSYVDGDIIIGDYIVIETK